MHEALTLPAHDRLTFVALFPLLSPKAGLDRLFIFYKYEYV